MPPASAYWAACALLLACAPPTTGVVSFADRIPNGRNVEDKGVRWFGVGHTAANPTMADAGLDAFGRAFKSVGNEWTEGLCFADSDGDGFSNGQELGDPSCTWVVGGAPARTVDISNPGSADSTPLMNVAIPQTVVPPAAAVTAAPPRTPPTTPLPLATPTSSGGNPATSQGGVLNNVGFVTVTTSSAADCGRALASYTVDIADGLCRELGVAPRQATARYGAALCDSSLRKIYVRTAFATLAECVAEVGTTGKLKFSPRTVIFDFDARTTDGRAQCLPNIQRNGVIEYVKIAGSPCVVTDQGEPVARFRFTGVPSEIVPPGTGAPAGKVPWFDADPDDSAPVWMIVVFVVLVALLVVACVFWAIRKARDATEPMTEDHFPGWPQVPPAQQASKDLVGMPGQALPHGPPTRAMMELQGNPSVNRVVANPIESTFASTPYAPTQQYGVDPAAR